MKSHYDCVDDKIVHIVHLPDRVLHVVELHRARAIAHGRSQTTCFFGWTLDHGHRVDCWMLGHEFVALGQVGLGLEKQVLVVDNETRRGARFLCYVHD